MDLERAKQMIKSGFFSFLVSFIIFTFLIYKVLPLTNNDVFGSSDVNTNQDIVSPLADDYKRATSSTQIQHSPSPTPIPTSSPTPQPTPILKTTTTPKPTTTPVSSQQLDEWFGRYAAHYSISEELLRKIAVCESKYNPNANNGAYGGMYQFSSSSWISTRSTMNENTDPSLRYSAEEAIKTAAFRLSTSGPGAWPNCSK